MSNPTRRHFLTLAAASAAAGTALFDVPATEAAMTNETDAQNVAPDTAAGLRYYYPLPPPKTVLRMETDICIIGGTHIGNKAAIGGISRKFYRRMCTPRSRKNVDV